MGLSIVPQTFTSFCDPGLSSSQALVSSVAQSFTEIYDDSVFDALQQWRQHSFVITDPYIHGHPIVYASNGFLHMSGYQQEEVIGRNPKFLQGPDTSRRAILEIRDAIREEQVCQLVVLNYTKQGWPFWILLHMAPLFSTVDGRVVHFVAVQTPLSCCAMSSWKRFLSMGYHGSQRSAVERGYCAHEDTQFSNASGTHPDPQLCSVPTSDHWKTAVVLHQVIHKLSECNKFKSCKLVRRRSRELCGGSSVKVICSPLTLALSRIQQSFVLCNPYLSGMPVVYASDTFLRLSGYSRNEVLGRSCKFLQGRDTDPKVVQQIRDSVQQEQVCTVPILNYKKDGTSFWNLLHVAPVRDSVGKVAFFVGVQLAMTPHSLATIRRTGSVVPHMLQVGAVGAVKVAVRSLQGRGLQRVAA